MEALKAEIERKRKINNDIRSKLGGENGDSATVIGKTRFIRQGDRIRMNELQLEQKQEKIDMDRTKRARLQTVVDVQTSSKEDKSDQAVRTYMELEKEFSNLSIGQTKHKLRMLRQPVTLFGETQSERMKRLIDYVTNVEANGGEDEGMRLGKDADEAAEEEAELEADDLADDNGNKVHGTNGLKKGVKSSSSSDGAQRSSTSAGDDSHEVKHDGEEDDDEDDMDENGAEDIKTGKKLEWDPTVHFSSMADLSQEKIVYKFFRAVVKQWESDLNAREDWEKRMAKGRKETKTQKQCKDYIRPLFRMCKRHEVPYDMLDKLVLMVKHCEEGNFLAANDQYIRTAIGNSAWPIGVTSVGIHDRAGREKISSSKVAHIMNNEQERKFLTSVKQLMTYAQTKREDVAPSMKLLNK